MIFAKRYESLIFHKEDQEIRDDICGDLDFTIRKKLVAIMQWFTQPLPVQNNRYDDKYEISDTLIKACNQCDEIMGMWWMFSLIFEIQVNANTSGTVQLPVVLYNN